GAKKGSRGGGARGAPPPPARARPGRGAAGAGRRSGGAPPGAPAATVWALRAPPSVAAPSLWSPAAANRWRHRRRDCCPGMQLLAQRKEALVYWLVAARRRAVRKTD